MVKQRRFHQVTRRGAQSLSAVCLSAFLVFGNAVSAFGNDTPRAKSRKASSSASKSGEVASENTGDAAKSETASATPSQPRKSVFRKVGEPFVVSTADAPQTSTTPQQTPAQRDATR